jgi:hypothetical protein
MPIVQTFVGETSRRLPFPPHANHGKPEKGFEMRDEMDGRMWVAHHEAFNRSVGSAAAAIRAGLYRIAGWDGSLYQLLALAAAFALTGLNLSFTSSAAA